MIIKATFIGVSITVAVAGVSSNASRAHRDPHSTEAHGYQMGMGGNIFGWMFDERATRIIGLKRRALPEAQRTDDHGLHRPNCTIQRKGQIGLQLHGGRHVKVWYKDIRIKELSEE